MHLTDKKKKNTNQLPKIEYKNLNIRQTQVIVHATQLKQCLSKNASAKTTKHQI